MQRYWRTVTVTRTERHANFVRSTLGWVGLPTTFTQWARHSDWSVSDSCHPTHSVWIQTCLACTLPCQDFRNKYIFAVTTLNYILLMIMINSVPVCVITMKPNKKLVTPAEHRCLLYSSITDQVCLCSALVTHSVPCHPHTQPDKRQERRGRRRGCLLLSPQIRTDRDQRSAL